jgi:xylulokinase
MKKPTILTYDIGTSSLKASLWDWEGQVIQTYQESYSTDLGSRGEATQNPEDWLQAVIEATSKIVETGVVDYTIEAIGFTGQMSGCLLVDAAGQPLYPAMTWQDRSFADDMDEMAGIMSLSQFFSITGQRLEANLPIAKLLWIKKNHPKILDHNCRMIQAQDWLVAQLTGNIVTDISNASGTGLLDIQSLQWSQEICERYDIPMTILPEAVKSASIVGHLTSKAAGQLKLLSGIPIVVGGGDGPVSALGLGITKKGQGYCQLGTSAWVSTYNDKPVTDVDSGLMNYAYVGNKPGFVPTGSMQSAGHSMLWAQNILEQPSLKRYPDSSMPYYFPYILGERSPYWFNESRGAFMQLSATHTQSDMYTAVLEGVAFQLRTIISRFKELQLIHDQPLLFSGGIFSNEAAAHIVAQALEEDIQVLENPISTTSLGAFYLAKAALQQQDPLLLAASPKSHSVSGVDQTGIVTERYNSYVKWANQIANN